MTTYLRGEQVKKIQEVLHQKGLIFSAPTNSWTAQAVEGYKHYLLSLGVNYPKCTDLPTTVDDLSLEMRAAVFMGMADSLNATPAPVTVAPVESPKSIAPKTETAIRIPKRRPIIPLE